MFGKKTYIKIGNKTNSHMIFKFILMIFLHFFNPSVSNSFLKYTLYCISFLTSHTLSHQNLFISTLQVQNIPALSAKRLLHSPRISRSIFVLTVSRNHLNVQCVRKNLPVSIKHCYIGD